MCVCCKIVSEKRIKLFLIIKCTEFMIDHCSYSHNSFEIKA